MKTFYCTGLYTKHLLHTIPDKKKHITNHSNILQIIKGKIWHNYVTELKHNYLGVASTRNLHHLHLDPF